MKAVTTPKWTESGSVIMQTEEYRLRTDGGIELVLSRAPQGAWVLHCKQLWSTGNGNVIAPSETTVESAQLLAINAAFNRINELGSALPRAR